MPYTLGPNIASNLYHIPIVRSQLTRALPVLLPELRNEIVCAFGDAVGMSDEWKAVPAMEVVMDVVARTSNRLSVSLTFSESSSPSTSSRAPRSLASSRASSSQSPGACSRRSRSASHVL